MDLSAADVDILLATIGEIREPGSLDQLRHRALEAVRELVSAQSTTWNEIDLGSGASVIVSCPDITTSELCSAFEAHLHDHPVIRHHDKTADGRPKAIPDFVTNAEFHASALYARVFRPLGIEDQISLVLSDPDILVGIACNGAWSAFTKRDRTLLNLLRPNLVRARRDAIAYDRLRWYLATMHNLLEHDGEGLLLVDTSQRVDYLTPNAGKIIDGWFGTSGSEMLPTPITEWLDSPDVGDPLQIEHANRRLRMRRLPGPDDSTTAVVIRESGVNPNSHARLGRLGLTARQAEILNLAADGLANSTIATQLHISERTVEQHVHAALNKLGATNRTQAARLMREH